MTLLKKLSTSEAECVIERLTSWARLQLEDKEHISDEVATGFHTTHVLFYTNLQQRFVCQAQPARRFITTSLLFMCSV